MLLEIVKKREKDGIINTERKIRSEMVREKEREREGLREKEKINWTYQWVIIVPVGRTNLFPCKYLQDIAFHFYQYQTKIHYQRLMILLNI